MTISEFLDNVQMHPDLALVHSDPTMCIIQYAEADCGQRLIRIGTWAVRMTDWERFLDTYRIAAMVGC